MPGIPCPKCDGTAHVTRRTRKGRGKVTRVRCCSHCGHQFRTAERVESKAHPPKCVTPATSHAQAA